MESWPTKKWGIGEKRLRTPGLEGTLVTSTIVRIHNIVNTTFDLRVGGAEIFKTISLTNLNSFVIM